MSDIYLEVNLHNLYYNLSKIKEQLSNDTMIMAVVKGNAYGHGSVEIAKALSGDVNYFGVGLLDEGVELRKNGLELPIFLMGPTEEFDIVYENNITMSICSLNQLRKLIDWTENNKKTIKFHLKVETGMNRFGIDYDQLEEVKSLCEKATCAILEGVYSHFATTYKNNRSYVLGQKEKFDKYITFFNQHYNGLIYHICNSENTIDYKEAHYNMVRLGNALYGPCNSKKRIGLKKIADIRAKIIYSKSIKAGEHIGYGNSYKSKQDKTIGIVPMGFYCGMGLIKKPIGSKFGSVIIYYLKEIYRYLFRNKTVIFYKGKPLEILGRPNMQYTIVDITGLDDPDEIMVEIKISPIFVKENIKRTYISEVKS
ncbi:alanine racemase [Vallitalea guaymasensis]|uniref:Alanine racemase n=1 Tax=Vallitalea guaymasensis TaxID=1185412 RepID=A0A8J8MEM7_9FIRM|nr:alanine racemase [Vallitalea guaymasensis]QUH31429.1 alanine racemase [Vallitalea guaymasensis]